MPAADTFTFCMLTPDGVLAEQREVLLTALEAHGFEVLATRLFQLDWLTLGRMYCHSEYPVTGSGHPHELPEAVMTPLYLLAPACVLVLQRKAGGAADAILAVKGATLPEEARPGSIRAGGEHALFNFLHCPDSVADAALELEYLVGREDAAALRKGPAHAGLESLREAWPAFQGPTALSFPHIARRLRWRAVQKLAALGAPLDDAVEALRAESLPTQGPASERVTTARAAHPAIQQALLRAAECHPGLAHGLEALGELFLPDGRRRLGPILRMRSYGLYLSELERVALEGYRNAYWSPSHSPWDHRL